MKDLNKLVYCQSPFADRMGSRIAKKNAEIISEWSLSIQIPVKSYPDNSQADYKIAMIIKDNKCSNPLQMLQPCNSM